MSLQAPAREALAASHPPPLGLVWMVVVQAWRQLRRMRTAMGLLAILAALSMVGTLLPQLPQNPRGVIDYILRHPTTGPWFARLGLFDIFGSWFFLITAVLMYTSLGASLVVRIPAAWRRGLQPGARTRALCAEIASIVFHASFFLLLIGVVYGKAAGFTGNAAIVEGDSFVEARANYDNLDEGVLAPRHAGFEVKVDSFRAEYYPSGAPRDFVSRVRVFEGDRMVAAQDVRVNHYLGHRGVKVYQTGYGWAPALRVETPDGRVVADGSAIFLGDPQFAQGVVKAPSAGPPSQQLGATGWLIPDPRLSDDSIRPGTAEPNNPILLLRLYRGDLHLDRAQNVYALDTTGMDLLWRGALRIGDSVTTPEGYRLTFTGLRQYTDLTAKKDPGVWIVFGAFLIGLTALLLSLYLPLIGPEQRLAPARQLVEG